MQVLGENLIEFGEFRLDTEKKILWRDEQVVALPLKSIELLCVLVKNRGEVVGKNDLIEKVWKDSFVEESVLTQNIYLLRKTLQTKGDGKHLIKNVPRRGYLFGGNVREVHTNDADLIIERHLFENVEIEEKNSVEETFGDSEITNLSLPEVSGSARPRLSAPFVAAAVLLSLVAVAAAFFYFRARTNQIATTAKQQNAIFIKSGSSVSAVKSLTILPLKSQDENLSNTFANDLTSRLGSFNKFYVRPFAVVREHRDNGAGLISDYVLDGAIEMENNRLRVDAKMIDTKNGAEIWTEKFESIDTIQLQDAVANRAAQAVLTRLTIDERERIAKKLPTNIAAYETFQKGFTLLRQRADGSIPYFKRAIELDQNFAQAYALLANARAMGDAIDSPEAKQTQALLKKAFAIDENLPDAFAVQGFIRIFHHRDWEGAEKSLMTALELDSNNVNAHHWLAVYYSIHRRLDEAKREMQIALEIDPTNPTLLGDLAQLHYFAGEKDMAVKYCEKALSFAPNHVFATQYLNQINEPSAVTDRETTLKQLSQSAAEANANAFVLPYINVDPRYEFLRDDPRFQKILRKINL